MKKLKWYQTVLVWLVVLGISIGFCISGWFFILSIAAWIIYMIAQPDNSPGPPGYWPEDGSRWVQ